MPTLFSIPRSATATSTDHFRLIGGDRLLSRAPHLVLDYRSLPFRDEAIDVVIYDPPFQPATVDGVIGKQFTKVPGGVVALEAHVREGLAECWRVARLGLIVKVQDYIHDHKPVWMSRWVWDTLGEPYDFVTLRAPSKLIAANWARQRSVWRNHSTFWIYRRRSVR